MKLGMNVSVIGSTSRVEFDVFSRKIAHILAPAYEAVGSGHPPTADEVTELAFGHRTSSDDDDLVAMYTRHPIRVKIAGYKRISHTAHAAIFLRNHIQSSVRYNLNPWKLTPLMIASTVKLAYKRGYADGTIKRPKLKQTIEALLSKGNLPFNSGMPQCVYACQRRNLNIVTDDEGYSYTYEDRAEALLYIERISRANGVSFGGALVVTPKLRDYLNSELFTDGERVALAKQFRAMVNQMQHYNKYMVT